MKTINIRHYIICLALIAISFGICRDSFCLDFLSPQSLFKKNSFSGTVSEAGRQLLDKIIMMDVFPTLSDYECELNIEAIREILGTIKSPLVFMFDIDDTLINKNKPKVKYFKELLEVLKGSKNCLLGIVTHRMLMPQTDDPENIQAILNSKEYLEIAGYFRDMGISIDDFHYFSTGVMLSDYKLYNYLNINMPSFNIVRHEMKPIEMENKWKIAKCVSLAYIDELLQQHGINLFKGGVLIPVDDDALQGHALTSLEPLVYSHEEYIPEALRNYPPVQNTLNRLNNIAGVIIPSVHDKKISFMNFKVDKQMTVEKDNWMFDLSTAILMQLTRIGEDKEKPFSLLPEIAWGFSHIDAALFGSHNADESGATSA